MVLAQVGVSLDQRCSAVAKAGGNILFRSPTHTQPTGKSMPQGVPVHLLALILNGIRLIVRFLLQSGFLQGRDIHPMVEVFRVHGRPFDLAWENPLGILPRGKPLQNINGFLVQASILTSTRFSLGQRDYPPFRINVGPFQAELFSLSKARQNGQPHPGGL